MKISKRKFIIFALSLIAITFAFFAVSTVQTAFLGKKDWQTYTYSKEGFKVKFLKNPLREETEILLGTKKTQWVVYKSIVNNMVYRVDVVRLPENAPAAREPNPMIAYAKLMISLSSPSSSTNPLNPKNMTYQGFPAQEYAFKNHKDGTVSHFRTIRANNMLYNIGITSAKGDFDDYAAFVTSLKIMKALRPTFEIQKDVGYVF